VGLTGLFTEAGRAGVALAPDHRARAEAARTLRSDARREATLAPVVERVRRELLEAAREGAVLREPVARKFDPSEPRDERGEWTAGGEDSIRTELSSAREAMDAANDAMYMAEQDGDDDAYDRAAARWAEANSRHEAAEDALRGLGKRDGDNQHSGSATKAEWDEGAHPRVPAGQEGGGEFTDGAGGMTLERYRDERARMEALTDANRAELRGGSMTGPPPRTAAGVGPPADVWAAWHERAEYNVAQAAAQRGETAEEFTSKLQAQAAALVDKSDVRVRCTPDVLGKILGDGRFKSQFETRTSNGLLNLATRSGMETQAFGYAPRLDTSARPVYGYMNTRGLTGADEEKSFWLQQYGGAIVHLSDAVRDRTTFTFGDSLPMSGVPCPVSDPRWEATDPQYDHLGWHVDRSSFPPGLDYSEQYPAAWSWMVREGPDADAVAATTPSGATLDYIEAQVHGGVSASDIASVELPSEPDPALKALLDGASIPYTVYGGKS